MTGGVKILAYFVARARLAVTNVNASTWECAHEVAEFGPNG